MLFFQVTLWHLPWLMWELWLLLWIITHHRWREEWIRAILDHRLSAIIFYSKLGYKSHFKIVQPFTFESKLYKYLRLHGGSKDNLYSRLIALNAMTSYFMNFRQQILCNQMKLFSANTNHRITDPGTYCCTCLCVLKQFKNSYTVKARFSRKNW